MSEINKTDVVKAAITDNTYGPGFYILFEPQEDNSNYEVILGHEDFKQKATVTWCSLSFFSDNDEMIDTMLNKVPVLQDTLEQYIKFHFTYEHCKTVKELRYKSRMSQKTFANYFGIPLSTLQKWEQGVNKLPDYVFNMMKTILKNNLQHPTVL